MKPYKLLFILLFLPFLAVAQDSDSDGLSDADEALHGCDINNPDSDNDGLLDGAEVYTHATDPINDDSDFDGLKDGEEVNTYATDPNYDDSDFDGLNDGEEVNIFETDPLDEDTDDDGLKDGEEVNVYGTDPDKYDTDNGGGSDGDEIDAGLDPLDPTDDAILLKIDGYDIETEALNVYPTIVKNELFINDEYHVLRHIDIYNISGQKIVSKDITELTMNVDELTTGMYIIKLVTDKSYKTRRFIKQ